MVVALCIGFSFAFVIVGSFAIVAYHTQQYWWIGGWLFLFFLVGLVSEVLCLGWVMIIRIYRHGSQLTEWDMPVSILPPVRMPMLSDNTEPMYNEDDEQGPPTAPSIGIVRSALGMANEQANDNTVTSNEQLERAIKAVKEGATSRKKIMEALNIESTYVADKLLKQAKKELGL